MSKKNSILIHVNWHKSPLWRWYRLSSIQSYACVFQSLLVAVFQKANKPIELLSSEEAACVYYPTHLLIQFLTFKKLCWLVRSNISKKPMASLKKAVVRLRNLLMKHSDCFSVHKPTVKDKHTYTPCLWWALIILDGHVRVGQKWL